MCSTCCAQYYDLLWHPHQSKMIFWATLEDLGHPQPKTPIPATTQLPSILSTMPSNDNDHNQWKWDIVGLAKKKAQYVYSFKWYPGQENLADYHSKHHPGAHLTAVRPYYLQEKVLPLVLPWATRSSTLKGCVGTLKDKYVRSVPLALVPQEQRASPERIAPKDRNPLPSYLQLQSWIPTLPKIGSILGFNQRMLWPFPPTCGLKTTFSPNN